MGRPAGAAGAMALGRRAPRRAAGSRPPGGVPGGGGGAPGSALSGAQPPGCVAAHAAAGRRARARTSTSSSRPSSSTLKSAKPAGVSNRSSIFWVSTAADAFRPRLPAGSSPRSATRRARATRRGAAARHARSHASGALRAHTLPCHVIVRRVVRLSRRAARRWTARGTGTRVQHHTACSMCAFTAGAAVHCPRFAVSRRRRRTASWASPAAQPGGSRGAGP